MRSFWQFVWLFFLPGINLAQSVLPLGDSFEGMTIEKPFLYQLRQPPDQLSFPPALSTDLAQWQSVESINYGRRYFVGWARFSIRSEQTRTVWLELTTHFMDSVGVWVASSNTPTQRIPGPSSYREQATSLAPVNHHYFLYALNIPARQTVTIWIRGHVVPGDALKFGVRLWQPKRFLAMQQQDLWGWATFVGIILAIVGGVLIAFLFNRRYIYLFYACYVICLSVYSLLNDGWGAFLPDSLAWFDRITTIVHWLNIGFGAFTLFSRRFLAVSPNFGRVLGRWPEGVPMLVVAGAVFMAEWAQQHGNGSMVKAMYIAGYLGFAGYGMIWLTYVIDAIRRKFNLVWLLIVAVSTLLAFFAINSFLINFGLVQNPLPDMAALRIALLIELAILSAGWLYRRKLLQTARLQLEIQNRHLQAGILQSQEAERQRIAADLHDDLGGTLATIRRKIADGQIRFRHTEASQLLDDLEPLIQKGSADLRRISHNLMPPEFARIGLSGAVEQFVQLIPQLPTRVECLIAGQVRRLPVTIELNLYRIVSELIQNILKHAQANRASVQLLYYDDRLWVQVEDDGIGITAEKLEESDGIGLKNSILRAEYIGASVRRETGEGGTFILLELPYSSLHVTSNSGQYPAD